jgi:hypothetical protein
MTAKTFVLVLLAGGVGAALGLPVMNLAGGGAVIAFGLFGLGIMTGVDRLKDTAGTAAFGLVGFGMASTMLGGLLRLLLADWRVVAGLAVVAVVGVLILLVRLGGAIAKLPRTPRRPIRPRQLARTEFIDPIPWDGGRGPRVGTGRDELNLFGDDHER